MNFTIMGKFLGMSIIFFSQKMSWASEPMAIGLGGFIDLPFGAKSSSNSTQQFEQKLVENALTRRICNLRRLLPVVHWC